MAGYFSATAVIQSRRSRSREATNGGGRRRYSVESQGLSIFFFASA